MFKYKRNISILLIILLLTGVTTTVYATDNSGVDEKYVTEEKIVETGENLTLIQKKLLINQLKMETTQMN